jgi:hypothetical protein
LLRDSGRQLRLVTDNVPVGIVHCDAELRYKFINRYHAERLADLLGFLPRIVIGKRAADVIGDRPFPIIEPYARACLAGKAVEFDLEVLSQTGAPIHPLPLRAGVEERQSRRAGFRGYRHYYSRAASAQAIGLALHELATNAGKYGALSTDRGRVDVRWRTVGEIFTMSWTERDGPPVSAPKRRGFGTIVMETMTERSVDGSVDIDYAPQGVTWRLTCPAANALESGKGENRSDSAVGKVEERTTI